MTDRAPLLEARNLTKHFPVRRGFLAKPLGVVRAVDGVSFSIGVGKTLGVVGESGCGKTTTAKLVLRLEEPTGGALLFDGQDISGLEGREVMQYRKAVQAVFQDPFASLNPRMRVDAIISEPLITHERLDAAEVDKRVARLIDLVGLPERSAKLFPHEFSGGQRQRIAIARSLAVSPRLVVLDEPVSALDVSIRAGVINLLERLKAELNLSYLFVAHDLAVVRHIADRVAVMYLGRIVEMGGVNEVFERPTHPYTQALLSAVPIPDPRKERSRKRILLQGDLPSPLDPPTGCRFRPRCPRFAHELADEERPLCQRDVALEQRAGTPGHLDACHYSRPAVVL
ncbi:MAG TPA: oligopeptide/dipeptide ABC transporter ATP-binding protein [Methylomirabilota bacterium]|nr:oligopeptide/dipeptide ABC transporter ATP-binding protein [Methylomirabilota bacterium]